MAKDNFDPGIDWNQIEAEYRAGDLSLRAMAKKHGVPTSQITNYAKRFGWVRLLTREVRKELQKRKAMEARGLTSDKRITDEQAVAMAADDAMKVVAKHRAGILKLEATRDNLQKRLDNILAGKEPAAGDEKCLGDRESPGDLLEKLSRITERLVKMERQAHALDDPKEDSRKKGQGLVLENVDHFTLNQIYIHLGELEKKDAR